MESQVNSVESNLAATLSRYNKMDISQAFALTKSRSNAGLLGFVSEAQKQANINANELDQVDLELIDLAQDQLAVETRLGDLTTAELGTLGNITTNESIQQRFVAHSTRLTSLESSYSNQDVDAAISASIDSVIGAGASASLDTLNQSRTEVNYDTVQQHQVCCETVPYECVIYCVITCVIKMCQDK